MIQIRRIVIFAIAIATAILSSYGFSYQQNQGISKALADQSYLTIGPSKAVLGSTFGTAKYPVDLFGSLSGGYGPRLFSGPTEPQLVIPEPTLATIYVSGTSPKSLPAGNDTTGDGSYATPYATVWKALNSVATYGGVKILVDGTTSENSSGRMIVPKAYTNWVLVDSYSGRPEDFVMTAATNTNPVFQIRSAAAGFLQIRNCTFRTTADGQLCVQSIPTAQLTGGGPVRFFDCILEVRRTSGSVGRAIDIQKDFWNQTSWEFINCAFKATGSGANYPVIILATPDTVNNSTYQIYTNIGLYRCRTTDANWSDYSYRMAGINGYTVLDSLITTAGNHAFVAGTDTSGGSGGSVPARCTNVFVARNYFYAGGSDGHGALIGEAVNGAIFDHNVVGGAVQGVVVKGATNAWVRRNWVTVTGTGALNGLYNKASAGVRFLDNFVYTQRSSGGTTAFREDWDNVSSQKAGTTTLVGNWLIADGNSSVTVLQWASSSGSTGGGISDRNVFETRNGAVLGSIRGTAVTTMVGARSAWASAALSGDRTTSDAFTVLNDTTYNDVSFTGTSGANYYCRFVAQNGMNAGALVLSPNDPTQHMRWCWRLYPSAASATNFVRPVPLNLPVGNYSVVIQQQVGLIPVASDPVVSVQALAYGR